MANDRYGFLGSRRACLRARSPSTATRDRGPTATSAYADGGCRRSRPSSAGQQARGSQPDSFMRSRRRGGSPTGTGCRPTSPTGGGATCRWCGDPTRASDPDARPRGRHRAGPAGRPRAPYPAAQRVVVFADHAALSQRLGMDGAKQCPAFGVCDGDFHLHQARCVHDDAVELAAYLDERHQLTLVKCPHSPSLPAKPRTRMSRAMADLRTRSPWRPSTAVARQTPLGTEGRRSRPPGADGPGACR